MSQSPDTHLFYGYCWDSETPLSTILNPNDSDNWDETLDECDDWKEVLLRRRGYVSPWDSFPDRATLIEMGRNATDEQYNTAVEKDHIYAAKRDDYTMERVGGSIHRNTPKFKAALIEWSDADDALKDEFSCDMSEYGSYDVSTAYLYIKDADGEQRSIKSSWNGPTAVDPVNLANLWSPAWDTSLLDFIEVLGLPMGKPDYGEAPVGPGYFMVTSYG